MVAWRRRSALDYTPITRTAVVGTPLPLPLTMRDLVVVGQTERINFPGKSGAVRVLSARVHQLL